MKGNAGSHCYFSPEACEADEYSGKNADLWACAVTLYYMVFGKLPFTGKGIVELSKNIKESEPDYNKGNLKI